MNTYSMTTRRRRLGRPLEDELAKEMAAQKAKEQEIIMCGLYPKDTILTEAIQLAYIKSMNNFFFMNQVLTHSDRDLLLSVTNIRYPTTNALVYSTSPYSINIGDIKLYHNEKLNSVSRCQVLDLYNQNIYGQLEVTAKILLIDNGIYLYFIRIRNIFDFPQTFRHFQDIEPGSKKCRLYLGKPSLIDFYDDEMNQYFLDKATSFRSNEYKLKIEGFENETYFVDIMNAKDHSLADHLKSRFADKIERFEALKVREGEAGGEYDDKQVENNFILRRGRIGYSSETRNPIIGPRGSHHRDKQKKQYYLGALHYFRKHLNEINDHINKLYLKDRFFKVRLLCWSHPESIFIIPADDDYLNSYKHFRDECERYESSSSSLNNDGGEENGNLKLKVGQKCLFLNEINLNMGTWMRGIIIHIPRRNTKNGFIHYVKNEENFDINLKKQRFYKHVDVNQVYEVRSIDYGYRCRRTIDQIRLVDEKSPYFSTGPWSLRCKLFGVQPLGIISDEKACYSESSIDVLDMWIREKILENSPHSNFYILFRTNLNHDFLSWQSPRPQVEITLFHRFEPKRTIEDIILPRKKKTEFNCLNSELINSGQVSDYLIDGKRTSKVDLDHHIINLLVQHDLV